MIQEPCLLSPRSCELSQALLERVTQLRDTLDDVERSLQQKHLSCCVFPQLQGAEEVASAIHQLRASRIGALIAVEREMSLEDYAKSGSLLNAQLSAMLLVSLFYPGNPLHDGAVFIHPDRIVAAGCFLPLSRNVQIGRAMGTRHRAALGISEEADAVAVDVSGSRESVTLPVGLVLPESVYATRDRTVQVTVDILSEDPMQPEKRRPRQ